MFYFANPDAVSLRIIVVLIDGNASASTCTKFGHAASRKQHFCAFSGKVENIFTRPFGQALWSGPN